MKKSSFLIVLLCLFGYQNSNAQIDVKTDPRVAPVLRQAANGQTDLIIYARKEMSDRYVNMAVLDKSRRILTWLTCYGAAYDSAQLHEDEYNQAVSNAVDPFVFYKELCREQLSNLDAAQAEFRELGKAALKDTAYNRQVVYHSLPVKSAKSTLQQLMAIEDFIKRQYLQLYLFDSPVPSQLSVNNNFLLHKSLAGKMVRKVDTITYYAVSPLGNVARMEASKQDTLKVFVYDAMDHVLDSFPLRPGKYTALCKSRDDVFLLYRGWLEFQSQQIAEALQQIAHLQHRQDTSLYFQAYWVENRRQLLLAEAELKAQQQDIERKINTLVIPDERSVKYMLQDAYPDKPAEISYMAGIGFGYIVSATRGEKMYELSDHRGNVMATVSDRKMGTDNGDGTVTYYNADAVNVNDYYPFGSLIPGRTYSSNEKYRYGFNGKENDNEVKGEGAQQDYGMRVYDPRIAKFLSVDPITAKYPELTPYQFASNDPVEGTDLDGEEVKFVTTVYGKKNTPLFQISTNYWLTATKPLFTYEIHKYPIVDRNGTTSYKATFSPFLKTLEEPVSTSHNFTIADARTALKAVADKYGIETATIVEQMYRLETAHFTSLQYRFTGTGGMEINVDNVNEPPTYGWDGTLFKTHPEYTPVGLWWHKEGKGMSGMGGNLQDTKNAKGYIVMPSVEAGMMYKAEYIERYNGDFARWGAAKEPAHSNYQRRVLAVTPTIMRELAKQYNNTNINNTNNNTTNTNKSSH